MLWVSMSHFMQLSMLSFDVGSLREVARPERAAMWFMRTIWARRMRRLLHCCYPGVVRTRHTARELWIKASVSITHRVWRHFRSSEAMVVVMSEANDFLRSSGGWSAIVFLACLNQAYRLAIWSWWGLRGTSWHRLTISRCWRGLVRSKSGCIRLLAIRVRHESMVVCWSSFKPTSIFSMPWAERPVRMSNVRSDTCRASSSRRPPRG